MDVEGARATREVGDVLAGAMAVSAGRDAVRAADRGAEEPQAVKANADATASVTAERPGRFDWGAALLE